MASDFSVYDIAYAKAMKDMFGGVRVIETPYAVTNQQVRFPRSKRKRIRKKWAANPRNYAMRPAAYMIGAGQMVVHTSIAETVRRRLRSRQDVAAFNLKAEAGISLGEEG